MADTVWDAVARFDDRFYRSIARMVSEEPVQPRDAGMAGMLRTLGIDKGKGFKPDDHGSTTRPLAENREEISDVFSNPSSFLARDLTTQAWLPDSDCLGDKSIVGCVA
jgi:hypothetical protein